MSNSNVGGILTALIGGVLAGAVAALLLAPKSGAELRAQIVEIAKQKGHYLQREEIEAFVQKVLARVKDFFNTNQIEDAVEEVIASEKVEK